MNHLFRNEIAVRILSVVCAVFLWLYVASFNNPGDAVQTVSRDIKGIKINKINSNTLYEKYLKITNESNISVSVTVEGKQKDIQTLRDTDFELDIDCSSINDWGQVIVPVKAPKCTLPGVEVKKFNPSTVVLQVERINQNLFPVELVLKGSAKKDYLIFDTQVKPNTVVLEEIESLIKKVDSVKVSVDIENIDGNRSYRKECKVYDKDGNEIPELQQKLTQVDVELDVARQVPVEVSAKGTPADGYYIAGVTASPNKVLIKGNREALESVSKIVIDPVNVDKLNKTTQITPVLKLPTGVTLANINQSPRIEVEIHPNEKTKVMLNNITMLGAQDTMDYTLVDTSVEIGVSGTPDVLAKIKEASFTASIDVSKLGEGQHKVPVSIIVPAGVKLENTTYLVEVKVSKK